MDQVKNLHPVHTGVAATELTDGSYLKELHLNDSNDHGQYSGNSRPDDVLSNQNILFPLRGFSLPSHRILSNRRHSVPENSSPNMAGELLLSQSVNKSCSKEDLSACQKDKTENPFLVKTLLKQYNYFHRLDIPHKFLGKPQFLTTDSQSTRSVESVWRGHISLLFRNLKEPWILSRVARHFSPDESWSQFRDTAKVRFYCQNCDDGWTSMNGVVLFYYRRNRETTENRESSTARCWGEILYSVCGQKCSQCSPQKFEMPLWYADEAQKVITNLYYEVANKMYGLCTPTPIKSRRIGFPNNFHNTNLCQGCVSGVCKQHSYDNSASNTSPSIHKNDSIPYNSIMANHEYQTCNLNSESQHYVDSNATRPSVSASVHPEFNGDNHEKHHLSHDRSDFGFSSQVNLTPAVINNDCSSSNMVSCYTYVERPAENHYNPCYYPMNATDMTPEHAYFHKSPSDYYYGSSTSDSSPQNCFPISGALVDLPANAGGQSQLAHTCATAIVAPVAYPAYFAGYNNFYQPTQPYSLSGSTETDPYKYSQISTCIYNGVEDAGAAFAKQEPSYYGGCSMQNNLSSVQPLSSVPCYPSVVPAAGYQYLC